MHTVPVYIYLCVYLLNCAHVCVRPVIFWNECVLVCLSSHSSLLVSVSPCSTAEGISNTAVLIFTPPQKKEDGWMCWFASEYCSLWFPRPIRRQCSWMGRASLSSFLHSVVRFTSHCSLYSRDSVLSWSFWWLASDFELTHTLTLFTLFFTPVPGSSFGPFHSGL